MSDRTQPSSSSSSSSSSPQEVQKVQRFISSIPPSANSAATNVTFDSIRDSNESDLCRRTSDGGRNCIKVFMSSTALFATLSKNGYFCQSPLSPADTEIHCTRIASGPVAPDLDVGKSGNQTPAIAS